MTNRKRFSKIRALLPRTPSDVAFVNLHRHPLLLGCLGCCLGADVALLCSVLAPALVLVAGAAACLIRHHSVHAGHKIDAQDRTFG